MMERVEKRFNHTLKGPLFLSALSVCFGMIMLLLGGLGMPEKPALPLLCSGSLILLGACHAVLGGWGVFFSRKQGREFFQTMLVVYEPAYTLAFGWILYILAAAFSVSSSFFCLKDTPNGTESLFGACFSVILLFLAFWCFCDYRCRSIILYHGNVEYTSSFGRRKSFYRGEVRDVRWNPAAEGFRMLSMDGKVLFRFERNMVNADLLMESFSYVFDVWKQRTMEQKETALKAESGKQQETKPSTGYVRMVRIGGWLLFFLDILLMVGLTILTPDVVPARYYFLLVELIPLDFFVFTWVFKDVVAELNYARWKKQARAWKKTHVPIIVRQLVLAFLNFLLPISSLMIMMHCVSGTYKVFLVGLFLFVCLMYVSVRCLGFEKSRISQLLLMACVAAVCCYGITLAIFRAGTSKPVHYEAEILTYYQSDGNYYAAVKLKDGTEERLEIFDYVYEKIDAGGQVVVCERTSWFDTRFVYVHLPEDSTVQGL